MAVMLETSGRMQVTLVSHYGEKPNYLAELINSCQELLSARLATGFRAYQLEQVHGTIIGLEGHQQCRKILNRNSGKQIDPAALLNFLREQFPVIEARIGGFCPEIDYGFQSHGAHPYFRSFTVQDTTAVLMGWPVHGETFPTSIDDLRWRFSHEMGVRHKWHQTNDAIDNDFYLSLGRIDAKMAPSNLDHAMTDVRKFLCDLEGIFVRIHKGTLRIVAYLDEQLPPETSCALPIDDPALTPDRLLAYYPTFDEC